MNNTMKIIGKIMLFFSSYFLLFVVLFLGEINNYLNLKPDEPKIPIAGIIIYLLFILISLYSILSFRKNYEFGTRKSMTTIYIKSVSSGSQEIISYLITMVIPLFGTDSFSLYISANNWVKLLTILTTIVFILIFYINTNLVVINPMLFLSGYSINKINFQHEELGIEFEGVLLSDKKLDLASIASKTIVDKIDENTFIIRRV
ncbi:MAG: hypothetical protein O8C64_03680 [Candidatus Methanoperedens sp.]|nr:hypothetical protein [Candidatus Methanoperedens sp.]MCZ7404068.1 hypothetical protein [Candidatus Methanoperedens sp.]